MMIFSIIPRHKGRLGHVDTPIILQFYFTDKQELVMMKMLTSQLYQLGRSVKFKLGTPGLILGPSEGIGPIEVIVRLL